MFGDKQRQYMRSKAIKQKRSIPVVHLRLRGVRAWHCAICENAVEEKHSAGIAAIWEIAKEKEKTKWLKMKIV